MLCIKNGLLILPGGIREADLYIRGDSIFSVGGRWAGAETIDAAGCWVFPGFVSLPDGQWGGGGAAARSERALTSGCTTLLESVTPGEEAEAARHRKRRSSCDWAMQGLLASEGTIPAEETPPFASFALRDWDGGGAAKLETLLRAAGGRPVRVPVSVDGEFFASRGEGSGEEQRVREALRAAERAGGRLWLGGIRSAAGLEAVRAARLRGVRVLLEADFAALWPAQRDTRAGEEAAILREALLRGEIELLGALGAENIPRLLTELGKEGARGLVCANRVLCANPAAAAGLFPLKGALKVRSHGDVTVWDPQSRRAKSVLLRGMLAGGRGVVFRYGQGRAWGGGEEPEGAA